MSSEWETASLAALVEYFQAALAPDIRVIPGWPEETDQELDLGPILAVYPTGRPRLTPHAPYVLASTRDETTETQVLSWASGRLSFTLQLMAGYRAQRDDATPLVDDALNNQDAWGAALILPLELHGLSARFGAERVQRQDGPTSADLGEWRALWILSTEAHAFRLKTWALHGPAQPTVTWDIN